MPVTIPSDKAIIDVTFVGNVVDLLTVREGTPAARLTDATMTLVSGPALVTQDRAVRNAPIKVRQPCDMIFRFPNPTIRPLGIAFRASTAGMPDLTRRADINMPCEGVRLTEPGSLGGNGDNGAHIRVANLYQNQGAAGATYKWEYYLFFQTADGKLGMIDPEVENDY